MKIVYRGPMAMLFQSFYFDRLLRCAMRPTSRKPVHKGHSAHKFKKNVSHTKALNMAMKPQRGGWRL